MDVCFKLIDTYPQRFVLAVITVKGRSTNCRLKKKKKQIIFPVCFTINNILQLLKVVGGLYKSNLNAGKTLWDTFENNCAYIHIS